ncbi:lactoferrin/transferrin family TonB-dependent receptor [Pasteurella sp. PK-2025]|uniref:lactoferrin/transferrin family TonB-dependent receptor n=1 Tax=Pasteurella sp. PK-2025 TaxID=3413133 RepID=UPI003C78E075
MFSQQRQFKLNLISISLLSALALPSAYAEDANATKQLNDVVVTGKKKIHRKENEVTGLGKVVKNTDTLNKEQILNIRDLTRYDPGISVVEQGRGASAGYSIRGVDRNRVALVVDGLPQIQSYEVLRSSGGSGAINEVEYENVRAIEISKGASSAEYGSGSLGGAVGFITKEARDIIKAGRNWGLQTKTAYSGKNDQLTNSIAFAGQSNGFEALAIYTHRKGKELEVHKDAGNRQYPVQKVYAYNHEFELSAKSGTEVDKKAENGWFFLADECSQSVKCKPRRIAKLTRGTPTTRRTDPPFSAREEAAYNSQLHPTEIINANDYTGNGRIKPNPMDYQTDSLLLRIGYNVTPKHYVGSILEHTKQRYDIQDMSLPRYFLPEETNKGILKSGIGIYDSNNFLDGAFVYNSNTTRAPMGLRWSRTQFIDELHTKVRRGILYRYTNPNHDSWVDNAQLSFDRQKITLNNFVHLHHCAEYPTVDKHCRATLDKPWSYYQSERNVYQETHNMVKLNLDKTIKMGMVKWNVGLLAGLNKFSSSLSRGDYFHEYSEPNWDSKKIQPPDSNIEVYVYEKSPRIITEQYCDWEKPTGLSDCSTRHIKGHNTFAALRQHFSIGKYVDLGLGTRYDIHKMHSQDSWTGSGNYRTWSWNAGLVVKPTQYMSLSYRVSTGFRVPSFQELFGYRIPGFQKGVDDDVQYVSKLDPEKAFNQEIGINFRGDFGSFETSFFKNDYSNMISIASRLEKGSAGSRGYHNTQEIQLTGMNVLAKIDWNGIVDLVPEGIYTSFAYNQIKPKKVKNNPRFTHIRSPLLDSIQPARYIIGLGYDQPEDKWGVLGTMTYSKGKSNDELLGTVEHGKAVYDLKSTKKRTKPWRIYDLVGYVNVKDFLTLRAGVYNVFNTRYVTWESVRQSSINSLHAHKNVGNYQRYAAPGRNFTFSMELKF